MVRYFSILALLLSAIESGAQKKTDYYPCFLKDSVKGRLVFIRQNAARIFTDTADCKDILLDSIAAGFINSKDIKYLDALTVISQNTYAKTDGLFTDAVNMLAKDDFTGFVEQLYLARGRLLPLQNELIAALNMIVNGKPLKQKYMLQLTTDIEKAKGSKDKYRESFLEKLKLKIAEEQYH